MKSHLPGTVIVLGFVSLFNDLASEMIVPLIPIMLARRSGCRPIALGLIEALPMRWRATSAAGPAVNFRAGRTAQSVDAGGYALSTSPGLCLRLPVHGRGVLLRSVDRIARDCAARRAMRCGRCTPRDIKAMPTVSSVARHSGAVGGSLVAAATGVVRIAACEGDPAFRDTGFLAWPDCVRRSRTAGCAAAVPRTLARLRWGALSRRHAAQSAVLALFTFARASETFIIRSVTRWDRTVELLLLWAHSTSPRR